MLKKYQFVPERCEDAERATGRCLLAERPVPRPRGQGTRSGPEDGRAVGDHGSYAVQEYRHSIAAMVRETEIYLWPDAVSPERMAEIGESEIVRIYPHRHNVPRDLWTRLFDNATREIEVLVYSGLFLTDDPSLLKQLRTKADNGTKIRLVFGEPTSAEVARRSESEGIGSSHRRQGPKLPRVLPAVGGRGWHRRPLSRYDPVQLDLPIR
jgi:hypothetical protein